MFIGLEHSRANLIVTLGAKCGRALLRLRGVLGRLIPPYCRAPDYSRPTGHSREISTNCPKQFKITASCMHEGLLILGHLTHLTPIMQCQLFALTIDKIGATARN